MTTLDNTVTTRRPGEQLYGDSWVLPDPRAGGFGGENAGASYVTTAPIIVSMVWPEQSQREEPADETEAEESWGQLARKARHKWMEENPY